MINEKSQRSQKSQKRSSASTPPTSTPTPPPTSTVPTEPSISSTNISLPLTPPSIDFHSHDLKTTNTTTTTTSFTNSQSAILDFIKQRQQYKYFDQGQRFQLTKLEYNVLLKRLEGEDCKELKSFVDDKLRWEYNSITQILYIPPMPSVRHDSFLHQVSKETESQLHQIATNTSNNNSLNEFASKISCIRSGNLNLREFDSDSDSEFKSSSNKNKRFISRQPDEQFQHEDALYPGVIYEIASSQSQKSLDKAAWDYIQYSNGNIKAVVGFELGYGKDMRARISMWKPRYMIENEEEVLDAELIVFDDPFRSSNKTPLNPTKTLNIPLDSFATSEVADLKRPVPNISITYDKLAEFLNKAEKFERIRPGVNEELGEGQEVCRKKSTRKTKKRKRESTPIELPLKSKKERKFLDAEKKEERVARIGDKTFKGKK